MIYLLALFRMGPAKAGYKVGRYKRAKASAMPVLSMR